eukprot:2289038-Pleurochrysis_carterae.AAC.1
MAKKVASSSVMSLLSAADSWPSMLDAVLTDVRCVNAMATMRGLRRILAADHVVTASMTPQLVESLDGQRKQRDVAVLVGWALKFFVRFGSQVRWIDDHRQELEAAFVLVELAGCLAFKVDLVDLGNNLVIVRSSMPTPERRSDDHLLSSSMLVKLVRGG